VNEQALKARIKFLADSTNRTFNEVWHHLILERFLVRVAISEYADNFIFKGGLLLGRYIEIGRETKDVDFLARMLDVEQKNIEKSISEIAAVTTSDKFEFTFFNIQKLDQPHMNYPGFRVKLDVKFGKLQDKIQIDIGVGDVVSPENKSFELYHYKGQPIFENSVLLKVYPVETIFAEKFETILAKGSANSRMKDFHDLFLLCRQSSLIDREKLKENLEATFKNRGTVPVNAVKFSAADIVNIQKLWNAHVRGLGEIAAALQIPGDFAEVVSEINEWFHLSKNEA